MIVSGSSSRSSFPTTSSRPSFGGEATTWSAAGPWRPSTSRSPSSERNLVPPLEPIVQILRREAAATEPFEFAPVRYRETRSVGMVVLADPSGRATSLADRVQDRLEQLGVYEREKRPWLPHVTVLRFRERPGLDPPLPTIGAFAPSGAAALLSRLHPSGARYEVLGSCSLGSAE